MNVVEHTAALHSDVIRRTGPILVIDDELDLLQTYERLFHRLGYDVLTAERGAEGLRLANSQRLGLVITDLKLPDIDGLKIIESIRSKQNAPPVIVVSGLTSAKARDAAVAAGADAYLVKPFEISTLLALIRSSTARLSEAGLAFSSCDRRLNGRNGAGSTEAPTPPLGRECPNGYSAADR